MALVDPHDVLSDVHWELRDRLRRLATLYRRRTGLDLRIRSGRRSCAQQRALYAQGRTSNPGGPVVTYADGCRSWHVTGRAVDADPVNPATGAVVTGCAAYRPAGEIWESLGGKWGGRFKGFSACGDAGHFEWHPGLKIHQVCPVASACNDAEYLVASVRPPRPMWVYMAGGAGVAAVVVALLIERRR